jgi:ABC-type transporter Mla MlaB component
MDAGWSGWTWFRRDTVADELSWVVWRRDGEATLALSGVLDYAMCPRLRQAVAPLLAGSARQVKIDVSRLRLVDACGVRELLHVQERACTAAVDLAVSNPAGLVLLVFDILGVTEDLTSGGGPGGGAGKPVTGDG